jgi:hypothetical protein
MGGLNFDEARLPLMEKVCQGDNSQIFSALTSDALKISSDVAQISAALQEFSTAKHPSLRDLDVAVEGALADILHASANAIMEINSVPLIANVSKVAGILGVFVSAEAIGNDVKDITAPGVTRRGGVQLVVLKSNI